jgi:hypothetical protein
VVAQSAPYPAKEKKMSELEMSELTPQEEQMLAMLREWQSEPEDSSLLIEHRDGAWDITLSAVLSPGGKLKTTRGTGATFEQAWDNDRRVDDL